MTSQTSIAVIGGGAAGLSLALKFLGRSCEVTIYDPQVGSGASNVAAGMLAPASEANFDEPFLADIMELASRYWGTFAPEIADRAGISIGYQPTGTIVFGADAGDLAYLDRASKYLISRGVSVEPLTLRERRKVEPLLSPEIAGASYISGDHQVNNRLFLKALTIILEKLGATFIPGRVSAISQVASHVELQSDLGTDETRSFDLCVIASGAWSDSLFRMIDRADIATQLLPVKGQVLRVTADTNYGPPSHVVRGAVNNRPVYMVPRVDHEVVIGATMEEVGFDTSQRLGAITDILADATRVVPSIRESSLFESNFGFRPGTSDNLPVVGHVSGGIWAHTGHFRHGVLVSPFTADALDRAIFNDSPPDWLKETSPNRFITDKLR